MKAVVAAFNQEKALVGAFSVITNLRMELFEALMVTVPHLADVPLDLLRLGVPHGVVEARQPDPEPVEAVVRAVDGEHGRPGVGLGHAAVALEHDDLGPDLIVDTLPLGEHLLYVVLRGEER